MLNTIFNTTDRNTHGRGHANISIDLHLGSWVTFEKSVHTDYGCRYYIGLSVLLCARNLKPENDINGQIT